ncbi:Conserved_hypothetical protein [Hexamita inflata]|uniref:Ankyrin repeat-containing protein n=1 Tax=Hexamita inflata TaxID=28002 RepID=A0AA86U1X6_9EUKA|nr:Conserved hypothetical protein [Hexamita inflata]CAI9938935.1 Conserved hypothetical protein [Hexamita inflata]
MFRLCKSKQSQIWFDSIIKNDFLYVKAHVSEFRNYTERRASTQSIVTGFAGVHYAALYGYEDIFRFLLHHESEALTSVQSIVNGYSLAANSSLVQVLVCANQKSLIQHITSSFESDFKMQKLVGVQNALGQNASHIACATNNLIRDWALNPFVCQMECYQLTDDTLSVPMIACLFGRIEFVNDLKRQYYAARTANDQFEMQRIFNILEIKNEDGFSAIDAAEDEMKDCSAQNKKMCKQAVVEVCQQHEKWLDAKAKKKLEALIKQQKLDQELIELKKYEDKMAREAKEKEKQKKLEEKKKIQLQKQKEAEEKEKAEKDKQLQKMQSVSIVAMMNDQKDDAILSQILPEKPMTARLISSQETQLRSGFMSEINDMADQMVE